METEKTQEISREEFYHSETHCPSCGRFVGCNVRCPYCQALTQKRLSIRVFKVISVLLSTVGLIMLLFYARNVKTQEVKIAKLGALSNFAHVRIVGEVTGSNGSLNKWGSLSFSIKQKGEDGKPDFIRVSAYSKVAKEIENSDKIPQNGEIISVEGQVRCQRDNVSLLVNAPEHICFLNERLSKAPAVPVKVELEAVTESMLDKLVIVKGIVVNKNLFRGAGTSIKIANDSNKNLTVWVPLKNTDDSLSYDKGDLIEAEGKVGTFRDAVQVNVLSKNGIKILKAGSADNAASK